MRQAREDLRPEQKAENDHAIFARLTSLAELTAATTVFCFISSGLETDTHALLEWLQSQGKRICVPKITGKNTMVAVSFTGWSGLEPGPFGIPAPVESRVFAEKIDVCITPGLGFTLRGDRLGHGQGYYDRWFAHHPVGHRIGLAYECQLLDHFPREQDDITLDMIITEQRVIRV